jgi:hypothetical protein
LLLWLNQCDVGTAIAANDASIDLLIWRDPNTKFFAITDDRRRRYDCALIENDATDSSIAFSLQSNNACADTLDSAA